MSSPTRVLPREARLHAVALAQGRGGCAARLRAIKADIDRNLDRRHLALDSFSARQRITRRYAQRLFESEGTSFTECVLGRRLARAHRLRSNPRLAERPISAIAFEAGFGDLSYFNRTFARTLA